MTNEEIRKLLGGYATNTLTDAERQVLFEAALDDQELFNAMQEEQALKDLLADPVSREQVRRALEKPAARKLSAAWWSPVRVWGSLAGAVAAAVVIAVLIRSNPSESKLKEVAVIPSMSAPIPQPATKPADQTSSLVKNRVAPPKSEPAAKKLFKSPPAVGAPSGTKDEVAAAPSPPPVPSPPVDAENAPARLAASKSVPNTQNAGHSQDAQVAQSTQQVIVTAQAPSPQQQYQPPPLANSLREGERAAFGGAGIGGFARGPLRFSLLKRDSSGVFVPAQNNPDLKKGDAVQVRVWPALTGFISLSQLEESGTWRRVFPTSGPGIPVVANSAYDLPAAPIEVTGKDEKFRVTLSLGTPQTVGGIAESVTVEKGKKSLSKGRVAAAEKQSPETSPLFVDLTIGPKN
jgi:hypothetical protein